MWYLVLLTFIFRGSVCVISSCKRPYQSSLPHSLVPYNTDVDSGPFIDWETSCPFLPAWGRWVINVLRPIDLTNWPFTMSPRLSFWIKWWGGNDTCVFYLPWPPIITDVTRRADFGQEDQGMVRSMEYMVKCSFFKSLSWTSFVEELWTFWDARGLFGADSPGCASIGARRNTPDLYPTSNRVTPTPLQRRYLECDWFRFLLSRCIFSSYNLIVTPVVGSFSVKFKLVCHPCSWWFIRREKLQLLSVQHKARWYPM